MIIGINGRSMVSTRPAGIGRYTKTLLETLAKIDHENTYRIYARHRFFNHHRAPKIGGKNFFLKEDYFNLGMPFMLGKLDIYHAPSVEFLPNIEAKVVVTVHDLISRTYPAGHTPAAIESVEKQFQSVIARADRFICASDNTRRDLHKHYNVPESKTCVIYPGVNHDAFRVLDGVDLEAAQTFLRQHNIPKDFLLFVGTNEPRKNLGNLLKAMAYLKNQRKLRTKLVVVGTKGWMTEGTGDAIKDMGLEEDVVFCGYLQDQELCYLYNTAGVFVFPSFYEGFGYPVIEAMSCGAPVVTANTSSCGEIAKNAALLVDPASEQEIGEAVYKILTDAGLRQNLREKSLGRAPNFSFEQNARETLEVYQSLMPSKPALAHTHS